MNTINDNTITGLDIFHSSILPVSINMESINQPTDGLASIAESMPSISTIYTPSRISLKNSYYRARAAVSVDLWEVLNGDDLVNFELGAGRRYDQASANDSSIGIVWEKSASSSFIDITIYSRSGSTVTDVATINVSGSTSTIYYEIVWDRKPPSNDYVVSVYEVDINTNDKIRSLLLTANVDALSINDTSSPFDAFLFSIGMHTTSSNNTGLTSRRISAFDYLIQEY